MNDWVRKNACWLFLLVWAAPGAGQYCGAEFLMFWPGARATALAGAYSAVCDDATACYYNQAGLAFIDDICATLQHCNWLPGLYSGMYYEYAGVAFPRRIGTFGADVIYFTSGMTDVVDDEGNFIGSYRGFDMATGIHYGRKMNDRLGFGLGCKIIYSYLVAPWVWDELPVLETPAGGNGMTFALDAGLIYAPAQIFSMSCALQNMGPGIKYAETCTRDPLPFAFKLGFKSIFFQTRTIDVMATLEMTKILPGTFSDTTKTSHEQLNYFFKEAWKAAGFELCYFHLVSVRGGYFTDSEGKRGGFTYGIGIKVKNFSFDWGIDQSLYLFETSNNKFALSYIF